MLVLGYPLWLWPSSSVPLVLQLVFRKLSFYGSGADKEEEKVKPLFCLSGTLHFCFSGYCWQGRGQVKLCFQHMGVCGRFEWGVRKECMFPHPCAGGWWQLLKLLFCSPNDIWAIFPLSTLLEDGWNSLGTEGQLWRKGEFAACSLQPPPNVLVASKHLLIRYLDE